MDGYDFVFVERDGGAPYRVRSQEGVHWLCSMHPDKFWVLRNTLGEDQVKELAKHAIKQKYAHMYELGVPFNGKWPDHQQ